MNWCGRSHLLRFQRFQKAIDHPLGSRIALGCDFVPNLRSVPLSSFPAGEHIGRVGIEITRIFASWPRVRSHSSLEPVTYCSLADPEATGNLLTGQTRLLEALDLLIARLSLGTSCRDRLFDLHSWGRTLFLDR
jgi:hypothetical protein